MNECDKYICMYYLQVRWILRCDDISKRVSRWGRKEGTAFGDAIHHVIHQVITKCLMNIPDFEIIFDDQRRKRGSESRGFIYVIMNICTYIYDIINKYK